MEYLTLAFLIGWLLDRFLGDPQSIPHPVVGFGNLIAKAERAFNKSPNRMRNGLLVSLVFLVLTYSISYIFFNYFLLAFGEYVVTFCTAIGVFFCLAGRTLADEVRMVFESLEISLEKGRSQVARIVGRDTSNLNEQQVKTAALETLAENLSDGVIAPMFWFVVGGLPGMLTYKMINTMDSMIGYKSERYKAFGMAAAKIDDVANYLPARLTALLILVAARRMDLLPFVKAFGRCHTSPNSGYPEAALAGVLSCRFGGSNVYHGELLEKPYIGVDDRNLIYEDMKKALLVSEKAELYMGLISAVFVYFFSTVF